MIFKLNLDNIREDRRFDILNLVKLIFKLDLLLLAGEQGLWTDHLRATKAFNADTLNAKVAHMEAGSGQARSKATTQHEAFLTQ